MSITANDIRTVGRNRGWNEAEVEALIRDLVCIGRENAKRRAFGNFIREKREGLGLKQNEIAKRMGGIITPSHVSNMENGNSFIGFDKLWPLAKALECEAWEIVAVTEEAMKTYDAEGQCADIEEEPTDEDA